MGGEDGPQPLGEPWRAPNIPGVLQDSPEPTAAHPRDGRPVSVNRSRLWATLCPPRVLSALHLRRAEQGVKCTCGAHQELQPARPFTRVAELGLTEPMRRCGRGMHGGHAVPAAAHRVRGAVPGSRPAWGLPPRPLPPRPAPLLCPRAACNHPRAAILPVRQPRVRRAPAPDLRARLCLLGARPGAALLPRALRRLRAQPGLQVRE